MLGHEQSDLELRPQAHRLVGPWACFANPRAAIACSVPAAVPLLLQNFPPLTQLRNGRSLLSSGSRIRIARGEAVAREPVPRTRVGGLARHVVSCLALVPLPHAIQWRVVPDTGVNIALRIGTGSPCQRSINSAKSA